MTSLTRRRFLTGLIHAGSALVFLPGCCGNQNEQLAAIRTVALVAARIGERTIRFPHPALRILSVVLIMTGEIVIGYLSLGGSEETQTEKITRDEALKLEEAMNVVFLREDDRIERFAISEVKSEVNRQIR